MVLLKTATVFDYERNASTCSIGVRVRDEHNSTSLAETLVLSDVFETIQFDLNGTSVSLINFFENEPVGTRLSSLTAQS